MKKFTILFFVVLIVAVTPIHAQEPQSTIEVIDFIWRVKDPSIYSPYQVWHADTQDLQRYVYHQLNAQFVLSPSEAHGYDEREYSYVIFKDSAYWSITLSPQTPETLGIIEQKKFLTRSHQLISI